MTRPPEPPSVGGVPASIAAIMAAIRDEVAAPAGPAAARGDDGRALADLPTTGARPAEMPDTAGPTPSVASGGPPALPADLDATVRAELAPLLKAWLDAHLPEIVETAVHAEIRRLTGQP